MQIWTPAGRLFQARMWREYAQDWDRPGLDREWIRVIGKVSRSECLRRARVNLYLARRLMRQSASPTPPEGP